MFAEAIATGVEIAEAIEGAYQVGSEIYTTYEEAIKAASVLKQVNDAFNSDPETFSSSPPLTQYPKNMPSKAAKKSHLATPGQNTKNNASYGLSTDPKRKSTRVALIKQTRTPFNQNALTSEQSFFDSKLLFTEGEKRLTPLKLHLKGKEFPDGIDNFLAAMMQKASVSFQFAGRMVSTTNNRSCHVQHFRHSLSTDDTSTGSAWPSAQRAWILQPSPNVAFNIAGNSHSNSEQQIPANAGVFREMYSGQEFWAGISRPDLEDMMWKLNTLKLQHFYTGSGAAPPFASNLASSLAENDHARISQIYVNNDVDGHYTSNTNAAGQPFRYNAVFNDGSVTYDFMNKGPGGAKVEIIVYQMKKHTTGYSTSTLYTPPVAPFILTGTSVSQLVETIGTAYVTKTMGLLATDAFAQGKAPTKGDVFNHPAHPLFPDIKIQKGTAMPWKERGRQTFAMPSGGRRSVTLQFGGDVYDPINIAPDLADPGEGTFRPILDQHSYMVVLAVSGAKGSQIYTVGAVTGGPPAGSEFLLGDNFCAADVQFYASYKEDIQACQFKKPGRKQMFCNGQILDPYVFPAVTPATSQTSQATGAMLPQHMAVRIPTQLSSSTGTSGTDAVNLVNKTPATDSTAMDTNVVN